MSTLSYSLAARNFSETFNINQKKSITICADLYLQEVSIKFTTCTSGVWYCVLLFCSCEHWDACFCEVYMFMQIVWEWGLISLLTLLLLSSLFLFQCMKGMLLWTCFSFTDRWGKGKCFSTFQNIWPESKCKFYTISGVNCKRKDYKEMFQH